MRIGRKVFLRMPVTAPLRMRWLWIALCAIALFANASTASDPMQQGYEYFAIGKLAAATPDRTRAGLALMGGGKEVDAAFKWLVGHAGHGHIVILRASGDDALQNYIYRDVGGVTSVQTLIFHSRAAARDPRVLAMVGHADGIFIAGGDQANYVRFWKDTPLNAVLNEHVRGGKPIGGTSAGLAILGAYSYGALDGGSITSEEALRDPMGSAVTLVDHFLQLPPLYSTGVITDSHFDTRNRLGRLIAFVARLAKEHGSAEITGIGVDENAALCLDEDGNARLFSGHDGGHAWLVIPQALRDAVAKDDGAAFDRFMAGRLQPGHPLDFPGFAVIGIGTQSVLHLPQFTVTTPAFRYGVDVVAGRMEKRALP